MDLIAIQEKLENLTKKWWLYVIFPLLNFFPILTEIPYPPQEMPNVIISALSQGLAPYILIARIIKIIFLVFIILIVVLKDKISRGFSLFIAINYFLVGILQNIVSTIEYGIVIIFGNMALDFIVGFFFIWEILLKKNDLTPEKQPVWKYWVIPLAFFAFWWPISPQGFLDINPIYLISSEAMLAYCAITPIYLAIFSLYHPNVNLATMRVTSFIGTYFGILNMIYWVPNPTTWWLVALHIPLLTISLYMFVISIKSE